MPSESSVNLLAHVFGAELVLASLSSRNLTDMHMQKVVEESSASSAAAAAAVAPEIERPPTARTDVADAGAASGGVLLSRRRVLSWPDDYDDYSAGDDATPTMDVDHADRESSAMDTASASPGWGYYASEPSPPEKWFLPSQHYHPSAVMMTAGVVPQSAYPPPFQPMHYSEHYRNAH